MWNVFKGTVFSLTRTKELFIWSLAFPIILSTMFMLMFSNLDDATSFEPIPTAIVEDENYEEATTFPDLVDSLSQTGDNQLIVVHSYPTKEKAEEALIEGTVSGIIQVDSSGEPELSVEASSGISNIGTQQINRTILKTVIDTYLRNTDLVTTIAKEDPLAFADPARIEEAFASSSATEQVTLTNNDPKQSVRYYYALLGMATLFCAQIGLLSICATQPNLSALGARRAIGAISRTKTLLATLTASWLLSFACLVIAFLYMRFAVGIDFGGRESLCIAALGIASLFSTGLGSLIGSIPKIALGTKIGSLTALTCFLSLFAGLYGEPCMQLADSITRSFPLLASINPAKVVADLFYSLYYYDSLDPFFGKAMILLIMAVVLFGASALFMRRQRYASL